jgi:hypothetical protein
VSAGELLLLGAPLLVTASLLALALREIGGAWRKLAEERTLAAEARVERLRLRREELAADERQRSRAQPAPRKTIGGFAPPPR